MARAHLTKRCACYPAGPLSEEQALQPLWVYPPSAAKNVMHARRRHHIDVCDETGDTEYE